MTPEQLHQIEQARRYAEQDEYVVTRTHIRNLLAIIDEPKVPFSLPEWHDATWQAMRNKALSDKMVAAMNIHTIRAFCNASFAALAENSGSISDPREAPNP